MALSGMKTQKRSQEQSNADSDTDASDAASENSTHGEGNAGWADSIAKVLSTTKPKAKKTIVLSRAKKLKPNEQAKAAKSYDFEIEGQTETAQNEQQEMDEKPSKMALDEKLTKRKNMPLELRMKPTWKDMERERALRKIATRGVVQLFNAVRTQQQDLQQQLEQAGPLDHRKDAVLNNISKKKFLDVLMSGSRAKSQAVDNDVKDELKNEDTTDTEQEDDAAETNKKGNNKKKSEWNVLRDDFMTNKKIKHWDEQDNDDDDDDDSNDEA